MAKNTGLKRDVVKYVRDGVKTHYQRKDYCEICDTNEDIEFHHYHTVSFIVENYIKENGLSISNADEALAMREQLYKEKWYELVEDAVSLCSAHHTELHKVYGQKPPLHSASKQRVWVQKQHDKLHGIAPSVEQESAFDTSGSKSLLSFMV